MDYSIHDAIEAGFSKIIFVIRPDIERDFRARIGDRIEEICKKLGVEVVYCFQKLDDVPVIDGIPAKVPEGRTKPWGTGQAVLSARGQIHEPFAVIIADDYYGKESFRKMHDWLLLDHAANASALDGASVPWYMNALEADFIGSFKEAVPDNPLKAEFLLPTHIGRLLREDKVTVKVLETTDRWFGVTYQKDKPEVVESIRELIKKRVYQKELYSDLIQPMSEACRED